MANIELPKDAEGREIPLDTNMLYDCNGALRKVLSYTFNPSTGRWMIEIETLNDSVYRFPEGYRLTPPDSWKKLEEDLGRAAERDVVPTGCRYFNATNKCAGCPLYGSVNCDVHRDERAFGNIISRIRKLRGED